MQSSRSPSQTIESSPHLAVALANELGRLPSIAGLQLTGRHDNGRNVELLERQAALQTPQRSHKTGRGTINNPGKKERKKASLSVREKNNNTQGEMCIEAKNESCFSNERSDTSNAPKAHKENHVCLRMRMRVYANAHLEGLALALSSPDSENERDLDLGQVHEVLGDVDG